MASLTALWLPILVAAAAVFVASSIMHMVLPYHRNDYKQLPDEEKVLAALRAAQVPRGLYVFPYCTHKDMRSPAVIEKQKLGPVGYVTIIPSGPPKMAKFLSLWFGYCLVITFTVALLTCHAVAPGASFHHVFHFAAIGAFLAYGLSQLSNGIWKGLKWSAVFKEVFDGLIYGVVTGAALGWLWPR